MNFEKKQGLTGIKKMVLTLVERTDTSIKLSFTDTITPKNGEPFEKTYSTFINPPQFVADAAKMQKRINAYAKSLRAIFGRQVAEYISVLDENNAECINTLLDVTQQMAESCAGKSGWVTIIQNPNELYAFTKTGKPALKIAQGREVPVTVIPENGSEPYNVWPDTISFVKEPTQIKPEYFAIREKAVEAPTEDVVEGEDVPW